MAAPRNAPATPPSVPGGLRDERVGMLLVFLSALFWSFGGMIGRFLDVEDGWTVVFWRSAWATAFLIA